MHHRTIAVQRKALLEQVAQRKAIHMTHMMMAMMIYTWMAIMPMVWMTQWMNLTRIGKYGRQIVKKRSRNDIILDRIRKQDTENMI